jgi:RNA polymerase sigma-70 factor (ECF subfamily)
MAQRPDDFLEMTRDCSAGDDMRTHGFAVFSRLQYGGLLSFLRRRVANEEDARDAAQESLMRLMRYRDTEPEVSWKPLLYRIAINVVGEQYRRGSVRHYTHHVPIDDLELASDEPTQEELVAHAQQEALLREAILSLPPRWRQVYLLSRMQGMTYVQIARHCGISVKTVEKHMSNALAALCDRVGLGGADAS